MRLKNAQLFVGVLILVAYISIGVFGLFQVSHTNEMPMANCPYAVGSYSMCDSSINHINHWKQFSNATVTQLFIFSVLILGIILYFLNKQSFSIQEQYFYKWKYYIGYKKSYDYLYRLIKWLSLFENSPPVRMFSFNNN